MVFVVVLDPSGNHEQDGRRIGSGLDPGMVTFEGFDEGLANAVAFGTAHWGEAGNEAQRCSEHQCLCRSVSRAIISEPLNRIGRTDRREPALDAGQHQIAHHFAADPAGCGVPGDDLTIARVDREGDADHLAIPASDLQRIGRPALVGRQGDDAAIVRAHGTQAGMGLQQQVRLAHEAEDPLMVDEFGS